MVGNELAGECMDLVTAQDSGGRGYVPPSIRDLGGRFNSTHTLLQRLVEILENEIFSEVAEPIDNRPSYFSMLVCCTHKIKSCHH